MKFNLLAIGLISLALSGCMSQSWYADNLAKALEETPSEDAKVFLKQALEDNYINNEEYDKAIDMIALEKIKRLIRDEPQRPELDDL